VCRKFNKGKLVIKAAFPGLITYPKNKTFGTFRHRSPFDSDSNSEGEGSETDANECFSEMNLPMKRAKTTDVNSGSPLLIDGESEL